LWLIPLIGVVFGDFAIYGLLDSIVNNLSVLALATEHKARTFAIKPFWV
jgi:hypothetical protein